MAALLCAAGIQAEAMESATLFARAVRLQHHRRDDEHDPRRLRARLRLDIANLTPDRAWIAALPGLHGAGEAGFDRLDAVDLEHHRLRRLADGSEAGDEYKQGKQLAKHVR